MHGKLQGSRQHDIKHVNVVEHDYSCLHVVVSGLSQQHNRRDYINMVPRLDVSL